MLARLQNLLHNKPPISVIREALGCVAHTRLQCLHRHLGNLNCRGLLWNIRDQHLYYLVFHFVAQVLRLHVLADVAEGLQAGVPEISIGLWDVWLGAQRWYQLVPLVSRQLDAGDGCQNAGNLASHDCLLGLEGPQKAILNLLLERNIQVHPVVLILRILSKI